jgi:hypothetical protein
MSISSTLLQEPKNSQRTKRMQKNRMPQLAYVLSNQFKRKDNDVGRPISRWKNQFSISERMDGFVAPDHSAEKTRLNLRLNFNRTIYAVFQFAVFMAIFQILVRF